MILQVMMVGVAQLKARLSEYLARVRGGDEVLVTDRGKPVARIVPVADRAAHLAELERSGLARGPRRRLPDDFLERPRPRIEGPSLVDAVIEERREGR
jgi:prevent-host-death family protein